MNRSIVIVAATLSLAACAPPIQKIDLSPPKLNELRALSEATPSNAALNATASSYLALKALATQVANTAAFERLLQPGTSAGRDNIASEQLRLIELNIERWRSLSQKIEGFYILVNIPGFYLDVVDNDRLLRRFRIIVGRDDWPTPEFQSELKSIVFRPTWSISTRIAFEEIVPALRLAPNAIAAAKGIRIFAHKASGAIEVTPASVDWPSLKLSHFPYRLVQAAGAQNPLGQVKFIFPNAFDIYIHDTPAQRLFERLERNFSHGCVRVEHASELAELLLHHDDPNWTPARFRQMQAKPGEQWQRLNTPVPVHLVYRTVWVDPDRTVHWQPDIYGCDLIGAAVPCHAPVASAKRPN